MRAKDMVPWEKGWDPRRGDIFWNKTHGAVRVVQAAKTVGGVVWFRGVDKNRATRSRLVRRFVQDFTFVGPAGTAHRKPITTRGKWR